jgi:O-antigen/teichoic acid export membrane protein
VSVFSRFSSGFRTPGDASLGGLAFRYIVGTLGYGVAAALALGLLAPPLIERLLPAYAPAVPILRILSAALVFRTLNATLAGIIQGSGRFKLLTGIALWNLGFVLVLLHLLVGRFQAPGAALALLIGEAVNSGIELVVVSRILARRREVASHAA